MASHESVLYHLKVKLQHTFLKEQAETFLIIVFKWTIFIIKVTTLSIYFYLNRNTL